MSSAYDIGRERSLNVQVGLQAVAARSVAGHDRRRLRLGLDPIEVSLLQVQVLVPFLDVAQELVLAVVAHGAMLSDLTHVRLVLVVAPLVVVAVSDRRERALTVLACVRSLAGVGPLMHLEVAALVEHLLAVDGLVRDLVAADLVQTNELASVDATRSLDSGSLPPGLGQVGTGRAASCLLRVCGQRVTVTSVAS